MMQTRFMLAAALCGAAWLSGAPAQAGPVNAADPVALFNVDLLDGTDLSNTTGLRFDSGVTTARGAGDFRVIPAGTTVALSSPLYLHSALGGLNDAAFSFAIGDFGTFVSTAAPRILDRSVTASSTGLDAYLLGLFSPAGLLAEFTPGPASFHVSFTRSVSSAGDAGAPEVASTSGSGTFASPPSPVPTAVPEPGSLPLLVIGPALLFLTMRCKSGMRRLAMRGTAGPNALA